MSLSVHLDLQNRDQHQVSFKRLKLKGIKI